MTDDSRRLLGGPPWQMRIIDAAVPGSYTEVETTVVDPIPVGACLDPECVGTTADRDEAGEMTIGCQDRATVITGKLAAPPVLAASTTSKACRSCSIGTC